MNLFNFLKFRGFPPPSDAAKYLDGTGAWSTPAGGGGSSDLLATLTAAEISVTGATTATISRMHTCSGTSADYTVTLPAASGNTGKLIGFRMATGLTKLVTIDGNASETIDGATTRVMWAGESAILLCDGSNWFKVAGNTIPMATRLTRATDQTGINSATSTPIDMTAQSWGPAAMYDSGNSRLKIIRAGKYNVSTTARLAATSGSFTYCQLEIGINGTADSGALLPAVLSGSVVRAGFSMAVNLAVNDYVQIILYGDATTFKVGGATQPAIITAQEVPNW